tara:strand:+ start:102 stop:338 length:237 start_codon:yes stop_codon:yes gene_type:complete
MTEEKIVHQIKLDRSIKYLLWGFVIAIALNAVPDGFLIEDVMAEEQMTKRQIKRIIERCDVSGGYVDDGYLYGARIDC